jgi:hypothetical protein
LNSSTARTGLSPIAVARLGAGGRDAQRHQQALLGPDHRLADDLAEALLVGDQVVRREGAHDRLRVAAGDHRCGQRDRGAGVTWGRLHEHVALGDRVELPGDRGGVRHAGDHEDAVEGRQQVETLDRRLEQRGIGAGQWVQELRVTRPGQRPEASARATGQHDAVESTELIAHAHRV